MSYRIAFHHEALEEYKAAFIWYENQREGLGLRFETVIEQKLTTIVANPKIYSRRKGSYREATTAPFPFTIVYKLNIVKQLIYISAIHHNSRNPKKKYRR